MTMMTEFADPPDDSTVSVERIEDKLYITIPYKHLLIEKIFLSAPTFILFCLVSITTATHGWELLFSGYWHWLNFLSLGVLILMCLAIFSMVVKIFNKPSPQRLSLLRQHMLFDNGFSPFLAKQQKLPFLLSDKSMNEGERITLHLNDIKAIRLENFLLEHKLFAYPGDLKLEIAPTATFVEKRWLYNLIKSFYQID